MFTIIENYSLGLLLKKIRLSRVNIFYFDKSTFQLLNDKQRYLLKRERMCFVSI